MNEKKSLSKYDSLCCINYDWNQFMNFRMAFAALEAMEELDLFGIHGGGPSSKIHVMLDEAQKVFFLKYNNLKSIDVW